MRIISTYCLTILFVCSLNPVYAQMNPIDSIAYHFKIQELQRKLTFTYYSPDDGKWWINRFVYNEASGRVSLKNIKAKNPNSINSKEYKERLFSFSDLNPFSMVIESVDESHGRMVKGKSIYIKTYDRKPLVSNNLNGNLGTPATFLFISIPSYLDDSLKSYSDSVFVLLQQVTFKAACFKKLNPDQAIAKTVEGLLGTHFYGSENSGWVDRKTVALSSTILHYTETANDQFVATGYYMVDFENETLKEIRIGNDLSQTQNEFQLGVEQNKITWTNKVNASKLIFLGTHYGYYETERQILELRKTL